jgi:RNA polymerase sigma-70 factor (ECF subfamily)
MSAGSEGDAGALRAAGEAAFRRAAETHRRELLVHCYRMLGSLQEP